MWITMHFTRELPGHWVCTYDRDTQEHSDWMSAGRVRAIHANVDREIRCRTLARAGLEQ